MAERQAHYFHSTLYIFSGKAVEAVIGDFQQTSNNVAVKCYYDRELDGFELTCPQNIGPDANDALHEAICKYVDSELEAAEREERKALIERFSESLLDDLGDSTVDDANPSDEVPASEALFPTETLLEQLELKAVFLHSVSDEDKSTTLKLFNLRDTGTGMLERALVHPGYKAQETVYRGFTCRAARWDPGQICYAFNGRSGAPVEQAEDDIQASMASVCAFTILLGQPLESDEAEESSQNAEPAKCWDFKGEIPTVTQFLDHMGETELVDPETARDPSEVPSDALRYNAAPEHQTRVFGRSRRPATVEEESDGDDDASDFEIRAGEPRGRKALDRLKQRTTDRSEQSADENCSDDTSSADEEPAAGKMMLNKLRGNARQQAQKNEDVATVDASEQVLDASTPRANVTSLGSAAGTSHPNAGIPMSSAPTVPLVGYDRPYAKVDENGLTGIAGLQAEWEHSNPAPSPRKLNKHGIARRAPTQIQSLSPQPTSNGSTAMSLSTGPELQGRQHAPTPASSFSFAPPLTMLEDCYEEPEVQPWANRTQSAAIATGTLVDVSTGPLREASGRIRPPPGLAPSFSRSDTTSSRSTATVKPPQSTRSEIVSQTLIDLTCDMPVLDEPVRTKPSTTLAWNYAPMKPTVRLPLVSSSAAQNGDEFIIERLQDTTNQSMPVRYTMRQKAGKKKQAKAKNSASTKPKVQLPMPDPPPQPKPSAAKVKPASNAHQTQCDSAAPTHSKPPEESHIEKLLRQVEPLHGRDDVELQVSFGMILVRPRDDSFCNGKFGSSDLQRRLQVEETKGDLRTEFFERLTTSASDAAFLFDLLPGERVQPQVDYEITLRLLQGETRIARFDQTKSSSVSVHRPEQDAITLFMHYPIRVHDARSKAIRSELALDVDSSIIESFVSSIHSSDDAPSFKALVPTKSFSVERVHVKRVFAKQIVPGVHLKIEEIQDLKLDPITDDKNFNLKATAASRAFMVDNHRFWYECSLHLAPIGGVQGSVLQSLVDKMVAEMDGIGYYNKGPYLKTAIEEEPEMLVKFW